MKILLRASIVFVAVGSTVMAPQVLADRWFGCGRIVKLNSYGTSEIRFDIEGVDYTGICQYANVATYGHHSLAKTSDNQWVFAMYLAAAVAGRPVKMFSSDGASGPCAVQNVPIQYCD